MKKRYNEKLKEGGSVRERVHVPLRYIVALLIAVLEISGIIGIVVLLCYASPYFYALCVAVGVLCAVGIAASDNNPDYKIPWLILVITVPVIGFMLYFMFYSRKLKPRFIKRMDAVRAYAYEYCDEEIFESLAKEDVVAASQARMLTSISHSHLFEGADERYFPSGREMLDSLLFDLEGAERFILIESFIIDEGVFLDSVLDVLIRKVKAGVDVRVMYDDIGCMTTLPGNYDKILREQGIKTAIFSKLRGSADGEFNNRSHRKIIVIDGEVAYTGGINIADEYIGEKLRFGHWKDSAIRLRGDAVRELTWLFLASFGMNSRSLPRMPDGAYPEPKGGASRGYVVPFGDGPRPLYKHAVSKFAIQNMLSTATDYVYMTTPYLIIDNDLCSDIERAALRGVDVRIIVPHIPDKKIVFAVTRSFYQRLTDAGVSIYEYEPGFIHSKTYVADGKYAIVGTVNLDYRSLVHHFEDGVWMYRTDAIDDIRRDIEKTLSESIPITRDMLRVGLGAKFIRALVRIFAPMM